MLGAGYPFAALGPYQYTYRRENSKRVYYSSMEFSSAARWPIMS